MLPDHHRLKHKKDFEILYKEGWFVGGEYVTMKVWQIDPAKYPRRKYSPEDLKIGFVVSVKVSKSAVKRNRAKRQMREVVRLLLKDGKLKTGYMVAIMAKPNILQAEYEDIKMSVEDVLKRGKILQ